MPTYFVTLDTNGAQVNQELSDAVTAADARTIINASTEAEFDAIADAGVIDGDRLKSGGLTSTNFNAAVADGAILPRKNAVKAVAALGAGDTTPTAAQMVGGVLTVTPVAPQLCTTDTAANIIANASVGATTGVSFEFTVINLGAGVNTSTLTAGANVTIAGDPVVVAATSATFLCVVTGAAAVVIVRK